MRYPPAALIIILIWSCQAPDHPHESHKPFTAGQVAPSTAAMIDSVKTAQQHVDPEKVTVFLSRQRADMYQQRLQSTTGLPKANLMVMYGFEELKAGNTRDAIKAFEDVLALVEPMEIPGKQQTILEVRKLLALSFLRLGEQENCILHHTSASCVLPVAEAGQHSETEGSQRAMDLYKEILKEQPDDLTSKYLLAIAAMTLGKYPEAVPPAMQLPKDYFQSNVSFPVFTDIAGELGLDRRGLAGGIAVEDFNNDGHLDIFHTSWGFNDQVYFHQNNGDGTFRDVAESAGLKGVTGGLNIRHADYNNDGFNDVLILRGAWFRDQGKIPNSLLRNNRDGTFTDVTVEAGLYSKRPTQTAVWSDFDLDGWLDLFIGNESIPQSGADFNFPSELYRNNGDGTFTEVSGTSGIHVNAFIKGATAGDVNNDGKEDLYISVLNGPNQLFLNTSDASGIQFRNISGTADVAEPYVSFPTWMFDFDNDGWLDIFVSAYSDGSEDLPGKVLRAYGTTDDPFRPRLYRNQGNQTFSDISSSAGLTEPAFTMGSNYGDLDNDGYNDIYLGTGEPNLKSVVPNKMYWNQSGKTFADITFAGGFGNIQKGHGVGFGDMDRDGDQDMYIVMGGSFEGDVYQNIFFENPIGQDQSWLVLKLEGVKSNRSAIGARIEIIIIENGIKRSIHHVVSTGSSFGGNSLQIETGLGKAQSIDQIIIHWPALNVQPQVLKNITINKAYLVKEGEAAVALDYTPVPLRKKQHEHHH